MKARIVTEAARVYDGNDRQMVSPISELPVGSEVELGGVKKIAGQEFVAVALPEGRSGWLPGNTKIYHIKRVELIDRSADIFSEASEIAIVTARHRKGDKLHLLDTVQQGQVVWVKVRDEAGLEGFIKAGTRIKVLPTANKAVGQKNMQRGALWCVGGAALTFFTYAGASSGGGGTYLVAYGPMIFGGFQFAQGLYQFLTAAV